MTDVVARPDAETPAEDSAEYAWAPVEPAPKKKRLGLWIGIPAGAAVVGLVASSLVLIAPGTAVAGVPVGWNTAGSAADALASRLADTTVVLGGAAHDVELTGADLSATIDARSLAESAFAQRPMWNVSTWFGDPIDVDIDIDAGAAAAALRDAAPALYTAPVDASVDFDAATASYVVDPAQPGEGIDVAAVRDALQQAFDDGTSRVEIDPVLAPIPAPTSTEVAGAAVQKLNGMLDAVGFYVGDERTVPVDRAVAASWLHVGKGADGPFTITADKGAIQKAVDALPAAVDRAPVDATVITDAEGNPIQDGTAGVAGRALGSTAAVAAAFATQLAGGDAVYKLPVTEVPFATTTLARRIEVDISEQKAYLFENDQVVASYYISSGLPGHDTNLGHFHIYAKVRIQDMGDKDLIKADYFTPDVPWVSYFNGDEALHGAYWHNNFGNRMSHGCVNMPLDAAKFVYDWAPVGTDVWVHA